MNYFKQINLPNPIIHSKDVISQSFLQEGINSLWMAIDFIHQLPYGRTTNRTDYTQVLSEHRGACSTKHALLATLAENLGVSLKLYLGMILLTPQNTPSIAVTLNKYQLPALPEAHCYLKYGPFDLDITFPEASYKMQYNPIQEIQISPNQIGAFKVEYHQAYLKSWIQERPDLDFETIWSEREKWIHQLGQMAGRVE